MCRNGVSAADGMPPLVSHDPLALSCCRHYMQKESGKLLAGSSIGGGGMTRLAETRIRFYSFKQRRFCLNAGVP